MVYPNNECLLFCYWILNISWQQLSTSQSALITTVYNAANTGSSVTTLQYNNFIQITSWRYPYYLAYKENNFPYSVPPVAGCDFWFNTSGLRINNTNAYGTVTYQGLITAMYDILGSAVTATQITGTAYPRLITDNNNFYSSNYIGCNVNNNEMFNVANAGTFTKNKTGYSLFIIARGEASAVNRYGIGFSVGTSVSLARLAIGINPAGAFIGISRRLDADAVSIVTGNTSTGIVKIACFTMDYSTATGKIYENGVLVSTNTPMGTAGSSSNTNSSAVYFLGFNAAQGWPGTITDTLAFNSALSAADVLTLTNWLNSMRNVY